MSRQSHSHIQQADTTSTSISINSRYPAAHNGSSAFSSSANANEDWTKISDLAERRRIQNRIAQRNYRKKLKRRLEDLERRASSSSVSPEPSHAELVVPSPVSSKRSSANAKSLARRLSRASSTYSQDPQHSPENFMTDDQFSFRDDQINSQYQMSCSLTSAYDDYSCMPTYLPTQYQHDQTSENSDNHSGHKYSTHVMHTLPQTLPTMLAYENVKQETGFADDDDLFSPFSLNYASLDMPASQVYAGRPARVTTSGSFYSSPYTHSR